MVNIGGVIQNPYIYIYIYIYTHEQESEYEIFYKPMGWLGV
jgi:hypothetical protein